MEKDVWEELRDARVALRHRRRVALGAVAVIIFAIAVTPPLREAAGEVFRIRGETASIGDLFGLSRAEDPKTRRDACIGITNLIEAGTSDFKSAGEVSKLQQFLKEDKTLYPEGLVTGFAGPGTVRAIKRYQLGKGLAKEGEDGFGVVGERTQRALTHDMCANAKGGAGVETPDGYLSAEEAQKAAHKATPSRQGLPITKIHLASSTPYTAMDSNVYTKAGSGGGSSAAASPPPQIISIVGPRTIELGKIAIWTVQAKSLDGKALSYTAYWGTASDASPTNYPGILTEGKNATFSTVFERQGAYEIIFAAKSKSGGAAYQSVVVSVGGVPFLGGRIIFDVRDASEHCPDLLPLCDRFTGASRSAPALVKGTLVRYFGETPQLIGTVFVNRESIISWQSLPAGQYGATISSPRYLPHIERFSILLGEEKQKKISLEKIGAGAPKLLRLVPEAGFYDDFIIVTGTNLSIADRVFLGGHYIGFLDTREGSYVFKIPRTDTAPLSCNSDFLFSPTCAGRYRYDFRPGNYSVQLQSDSGTSTKAMLQVFEKTNAQPFSPAVMSELLKQTPMKNRFAP